MAKVTIVQGIHILHISTLLVTMLQMCGEACVLCSVHTVHYNVTYELPLSHVSQHQHTSAGTECGDIEGTVVGGRVG